MGRIYRDCGNCKETFHVDDEEIHYCDKCKRSVCDQCCTVDEEGNVTECDSCETVQLREATDNMHNARMEGKISRLETIKEMCLQKHKRDVGFIIDDIIKFIKLECQQKKD